MSRVSLVQFADDTCPIPAEVVPSSYRAGARRWLYFIDRGANDAALNLRDLVLLPCSPDEIARLYCVVLGINNAPGATAVGTNLMRDFGLRLKFEQAYDSLSGDIGSKTCVVVFPPDKTPRDFDTFVADWVARGSPGSHLIRKAAEHQTEICAAYSRRSETFFGQYAFARRYLPAGQAALQPIGDIEVQQNTTVSSAPQLLVLRLTDAQRSRVEKKLKSAYGEEHDLAGRWVQVYFDSDFEALSFSFLNPDDILCFISVEFGGDSDEVNAVVRWLGERGVDFRQYQLVENERDAGFEFRLLCDLSQTDLHLFDQATLRELLRAELEHQLRAPLDGGSTRLRALDVDYKHDTILYSTFTGGHRFRLLSVVLLNEQAEPLHAWPERPDDAVLERIAGEQRSASTNPRFVPVPGGPRRHAVIGRHPKHAYVVAAVYENRPPDRFEAAFRHLCAQLPAEVTTDDALGAAVRKHLLRGLRFEFLPSRDEFQALGTLPREQFLKDNEQRFSALGWNYVTEKWERDRFPIRGNLVLAKMLGTYLENRPDLRARLAHAHDAERIRICDIGPGVGALTTILALRRNSVLWENLDRLDVVFVDSARRVLEMNQAAEGFRELPDPLLEDLQLSHDEERQAIVDLLRRSTHICCDVSDIEATRRAFAREGVEPFDIIYSAFCHHHMNLEMKRGACGTMLEWAKEGAFLGIADESLTYKQYLLYRIGHSLDQVGIATESYFQAPEEHARCFGERLHVEAKERRSKFYAFWGQVRPPKRLMSGQGEERAGQRTADQTFDVFLCHNADDKPAVRKINAAMEKRGILTWLDKDQLDGGERWQEELEKQIGQVPNACVFVGPNGQGPWQSMEFRAILDRSVKGTCRLIPVLLPGAPEEPDVPLFLNQMTWVDLRTDYDRNLVRLINILRQG